jgi:hypothetical protein
MRAHLMTPLLPNLARRAHAGRRVANEIKVPKSALGNGLAFKRLDDLWIGPALRDQCVECVLVYRGRAAGENGFFAAA